jgi:very-short-patch-repair endonuclease
MRHGHPVDIRDLIARLGVDQFGLVARRQLREAGISDQRVTRRIRNGQLEIVTSRVLGIPGTPNSIARTLMTPLLHVGDGTLLSHTTAAAGWGMAGFRLDKVHVSIERNRHWEEDTGSVVVHHATKIPEWCRKQLNGIPVVSPGLAVYQLAGTINSDRVARALDNAWSLGLLDGATVDRLLYELGRPGRDGTVLMRKLRAERSGAWTPPASNLEHRFDEIMVKAGVTTLRRQVDIGDEDWSARVDFLDRQCPLVIEILSERYHTALLDREADEARRARHERMGLTVIEVWDHEIFYTPWLVVERVRDARKLLLAAA